MCSTKQEMSLSYIVELDG